MASPFASIARVFRSALGKGRGSSSVLGIDIGASSVKIVQLRTTRGSAILETYGEISLGPYGGVAVGKASKLTIEKISDAITDLMKEANITARSGGISIPFASSLMSILDMPNVNEEQLKRMMPIEARKYIPVPVSEVMLDWFVLPQEESDDAFDRVEDKTMMQKRGQEVLLVAIHNETLRNYQSITQSSGVSISFYEIEIFSTIRSSLGHGVVPVVVVDLGASTTKVYVVERGVVRLSHLINTGGQQMTETLARSLNWSFEKAERIKREWGLNESPTYTAEENARIQKALLSTLSRVFSETNRVLLSYGKRYNKNVSHVVMTGGGASLPGLTRSASESLNAEVKMAEPFSKVETPAFLDDVLRDIGPGFSVAVGVALRKLQQES
jgi:type IV pilus assembly protein PilM